MRQAFAHFDWRGVLAILLQSLNLIMSLIEGYIRRYEHGRWANEPDRRTPPFDWGLGHIGGRVDDPEPGAFLETYAARTIAQSDEWFIGTPARDYRLDRGGTVPGEAGVLTFTSAVKSPWPENNFVYGRFFPARHSGPAVIVLGQWNALWEQYADICRWLNRLGITALKLSLPYHDRRAIPGHTRAGHLVGPNIGLTMQANRQAVSDVRRAARWLAAQGYGKIGVLGASIGSSVGFIALAHDPEIRAGAFLHVSTYFGGVVATGLTTMHVWEAMRGKVSAEDLQRYWAPISPQPYFHKLRGSGKKCLAIIGGNDPTFPPDYSDDFLTAMRDQAFEFEVLTMPCGHYSLGEAPFKYIAGFRFGTFLFETLA
jgi:hypothetical protein